MTGHPLSEAIDQVLNGKVGRVCVPGNSRGREDDGEVYIESMTGLQP